MTATADRLVSAENDLTYAASNLYRLADGIKDDITLFVAFSSHRRTVSSIAQSRRLHGIQADLDRIEREARALRFLLTELKGE